MNDAVDITVVRRFAAAPEAVFDAWLDPHWLGRWMFGAAVRDERIIHLRTDARVGGGFSFLVERQGQRIDHVGRYLALQRPRTLAFTWAIAGESDDDASRVAIDIQPLADGCQLRLVHSIPARWAEYAARTEQGWSIMLDALARLF